MKNVKSERCKERTNEKEISVKMKVKQAGDSGQDRGTIRTNIRRRRRPIIALNKQYFFKTIDKSSGQTI
jgi:hypothetical protein